jgi:hypothetical protein
VFQVATPVAQNAVRFMRESQCFVSNDFDGDCETAERDAEALKREYVLPDGREITVVGERFRAPELLFECKEKLGLPFRIVDAVLGCAESIQVRVLVGSRRFRRSHHAALRQPRRYSVLLAWPRPC